MFLSKHVSRVVALIVLVAGPGCEASSKGGEGPVPVEQLLEPALDVSREFECDPSGVGSELLVSDAIDGLPGEQLLIRPAGAEPCKYHLIHRDARGRETTLSSTPGGYLLALALGLPGGDALVCASNIQHHPLSDELSSIDNVTLECARRRGGVWMPLRTVVDPAGRWAAWIREMRVLDAATGELEVRFTHDFSFQFMNLGDNGRPEDDGVYGFVARLGDRGLTVSPPVLISTVTNPAADDDVEAWNPTEEEQEALGDLIDFSGVEPADDRAPRDAGTDGDAAEAGPDGGV